MGDYEDILQKKADKYVKLTEPGSFIEGYYIGHNPVPAKDGFPEGKCHIFKTKDGNVGLYGKANSDRQLTPNLEGYCLKITFTGMSVPANKARKPAYLYRVQIDRSNKIDLSDLAQQEGSWHDTDADSGEDNDATGYPDTAATSYRSPAPVSTTRPSAPSAEDQAKVRAAMASARVTR